LRQFPQRTILFVLTRFSLDKTIGDLVARENYSRIKHREHSLTFFAILRILALNKSRSGVI